MTDAEKVEALQSAIVRADRTLDWILLEGGYPEKLITMATRIRGILHGALRKTEAPRTADGTAFALPKAALGPRAIKSMIQDGIIQVKK